MKAFARTLHVPLYAAVGLLELLWHFTARFAPQGDVGRFDDAALAEALGFDGDPSALTAALVTTGWLDACPTNRLLVHGWEDHADQGVRNTLKGRGLLFLHPTPIQPKSNRSRTRVGPVSDTGRPGTGTGSGSVSSGEREREREGAALPRTPAALTTAFETRFWPAYPPRNGRRDGKQEALAEWLKLKPDEALEAVMLTALAAYARSTDLPKDAVRWLRGKRWTDEVAAAVPTSTAKVRQMADAFRQQLAAKGAT